MTFLAIYAKMTKGYLENWLENVWGIRKNWSRDDLPTPHIPGPEDFADFLS
jgi:hypothetical protein